MPVHGSNQNSPPASRPDRLSRNGEPSRHERTTIGPPVRRTRVGATWVGVAVGALLLVLLIIFMLQNTAPVDVAFLGMSGTAPLALTLLIAGVGVGVVALIIGSIRIGQLRHRITKDRRPAGHAAH